LFGGGVALRLVPTSSEGPPLFPDRCALLLRERPLGRCAD
jgi:hypothetical protein